MVKNDPRKVGERIGCSITGCSGEMVSRSRINEVLDLKGFDAILGLLSDALYCSKAFRDHPLLCSECHEFHPEKFCDHDWSAVEDSFIGKCSKCGHEITNAANFRDWLYDDDDWRYY